MKKIIFTAMLLAFSFAMPQFSYALVDAEMYGGYSFKGEFTGDPAVQALEGDDIKGWNYGFRAHFNQPFLFLFRVGLGPYVEYMPHSYDSDLTNSSIDVKQTTYGLDAYIKLDLPLVPVKPYVRGGIAAYDKAEFETNGTTETEKKYFKSRYYGAGLALTVLPLPLIDAQIFGEYLYHYSSYDDNAEITSHSVNFGALISL